MSEMVSHLIDAGYVIEQKNGVYYIVDRVYTGLTVDLMHAGCSSAPAAYWNQNRLGERWIKNNGQAQYRVRIAQKSGRVIKGSISPEF